MSRVAEVPRLGIWILGEELHAARTRVDGIQRARTWCGHGVFSHNLVKIAGLIP